MKTNSAAIRPNSFEDLPKDLVELGLALARLPEVERSQLQPLFDRISQNTRRRQRILSLVQEALGQLRLDMKYLLFDLEATRKERDELRGKHNDERGF